MWAAPLLFCKAYCLPKLVGIAKLLVDTIIKKFQNKNGKPRRAAQFPPLGEGRLAGTNSPY